MVLVWFCFFGVVFLVFWCFFLRKPSKARLKSCRTDVSHPALAAQGQSLALRLAGTRASPGCSCGSQHGAAAGAAEGHTAGLAHKQKILASEAKASNEHHIYHCVNQG